MSYNNIKKLHNLLSKGKKYNVIVVHNNKACGEESSLFVRMLMIKRLCACPEQKPITLVMLVKLSPLINFFQSFNAFCVIFCGSTGTSSCRVGRM